uniref:Uncharacterized protein n=1 Tax=Oryzias sinensis TaxID=183150 RepID=A0A8C7YCL0_9TELE
MAKSSNRIRMPDSFRVIQPTLSKNTWIGSLQQYSAEPPLEPVRLDAQHCWLSPHWTSPQLRAASQADTKHADTKVRVVLPPPINPGRCMTGSRKGGNAESRSPGSPALSPDVQRSRAATGSAGGPQVPHDEDEPTVCAVGVEQLRGLER